MMIYGLVMDVLKKLACVMDVLKKFARRLVLLVIRYFDNLCLVSR